MIVAVVADEATIKQLDTYKGTTAQAHRPAQAAGRRRHGS